MRIKKIILFIISSLVLFIACVGCQNKIEESKFNGSFEIKSTFKDEPNGWFATRVPQTSEFVSFEWDSIEKHSGSNSVSIAIDSTHPQDEIAYNWTRIFDDFKINGNYSISGWIKTQNLLSPAFIVVQCWDANKKMIGFSTTQRDFPIEGTKDWTQVNTEFTVPENTIEVRIRIGIASPKNNGGEVWFDDIEIKEK